MPSEGGLWNTWLLQSMMSGSDQLLKAVEDLGGVGVGEQLAAKGGVAADVASGAAWNVRYG